MNPWTHAARYALAATSIAGTMIVAASPAAATTCARGTGPAELTQLFSDGVDALVGADYQRAIELPDHRVLWLFQDGFLSTDNGAVALVHNVGVLQQGHCFTLLHSGTTQHPTSWIASELAEPMQRWFWPLGGVMATDGTLRIFVAEMRERGARYLTHSEPVATWMATIDPVTLTPINFTPAPDPSPNLYGWSVASDNDHTYLFGHCYRQFGYSFLGHDPCTAEIRVARVPRGDPDRTPQYWNGTTWVPDPSSAVNIAPTTGPDGERRGINPMQFAYLHGRWIAVTKEGDWWGRTIYLDHADTPTGPWTTMSRLEAMPLGPANEYNTYFASFIPSATGTTTIALSNNRWDGQQSHHYRPTFQTVPEPVRGRPRRQPPTRVKAILPAISRSLPGTSAR